MNLDCAQCGGKFPLHVESPFARCPFCSCTLYLDRASSFRHLGLPARIGPSAAMDLLRGGARRRNQPLPEPLDVVHVVLPFWSVRSESVQETLPAFSPLPVALAPFRLPAAQPAWFDPGDYPGFSVQEPSEESPLAWEGRYGKAAATLYAVPFFKVRYGGGTKPYEAWVDAAGSRVFWGIGPPAGNEAASRRFVKVIGGMVALFGAEAFLLPGGWLALSAVGVTGAILYPWARRTLAPGDSA